MFSLFSYHDFIVSSSKDVSSSIYAKLCETNYVRIVFATSTFLKSSIANELLCLTFKIPNASSTVTLAEDKYLLKFVSCAEKL